MIDESGSMPAKPLSPEMRKLIDDAIAAIKNSKNLDQFPLKKHVFEKKIYEEKIYDPPLFEKKIFKEKFKMDMLDEKYGSLAEKFGIIASARERARQNGEALAEACHAGTAGVTPVMRPLSFRRGFISMRSY